MKNYLLCLFFLFVSSFSFCQETSVYIRNQVLSEKLTYPIVDTGQISCYNGWKIIYYPKTGGYFYGQDAQYKGNTPSYKDNGDGTVTDLQTGLMWSKGVRTVTFFL